MKQYFLSTELRRSQSMFFLSIFLSGTKTLNESKYRTIMADFILNVRTIDNICLQTPHF